MPNKILKLFDKQFANNFFQDKILPELDGFSEIIDLEIVPRKNYIWTTSYHVVIEYRLLVAKPGCPPEKLLIFCTAHDNEPRKKVINNLRLLWENGFGVEGLNIPKPLIFSQEYNASFYLGFAGNDLYHYIKRDDRPMIEKIIPLTAHWFASLHNIPTGQIKNFEHDLVTIKDVVPGIDHIYTKIKNLYPNYYEVIKKIYFFLCQAEDNFLKKAENLYLVHGDAHPENIIIINNEKIGVIDFTDLCLTDFARDLGSFMQQLDYMMMKKINDQTYTDKIKSLFLEKYLENAKIELTTELNDRIKTYYNWTQMRTATYFLLKHEPQPERAKPLIDTVKINLNIQ